MSAPSFAELEVAAGAVIAILKTMPEFSNAKIAVIGGLGLWNYLRGYRTTEVLLPWPFFSTWINCLLYSHQDVDFLITVQGAPKAVKDKLLALPSTPFQQQAQLFFYKSPGGKLVQIDITPDWQVRLPLSNVSIAI